MSPLRQFVGNNRRSAWLLIALAFLMKLAIPVGFMPAWTSGTIGLVECDGLARGGGGAMASMPGMATHHDRHPAKSEAPCPFAGISTPALTGSDPAPPTVAIITAFAFLLLGTANPPIHWHHYARPPLRGPPARA